MGLKKRWITAGTNPGLWGTSGTYGVVDWEDLPEIDASRHDGSWGWLAEKPEVHGIIFGNDEDNLPDEAEIARRVERIVAAAEAEGLTVPPAFRTLFADPERTYLRLPTCTACYFDLGDRVTEIPGEPGRFLRFMNDQQCVFVWGLHLLPDGSHRVVVARPRFEEDARGEQLEDVATFVDHAVCGADLEEFLHRFWLENAIWFAQRSGITTPDMDAYVNSAKNRRARRTTER
jgi:hypothetical protein